MAGTKDLEVVNHRLDGHDEVLRQLIKGVNDLKEAVLSIPKQSSISERMKTVAATVAIVVAFLGLSEGWLSTRLTADRQTVSRIERHTDDVPVLRYRIEQLEKYSSGPAR